jgi:predicted component of type VI protein secretion system
MRISVQIEFDKTLDLVTGKNSVTIGRSSEISDLVIPHPSISRKHCLIEYDKQDKCYYITDLGSSNGVSINGQKIPANNKRKVSKGSQLSIGGLDCEISDYIPNVAPEKIISAETSDKGDYTATIRISRIDLNQPSVTLDLEKKKATSPKKPRNPVIQNETEAEVEQSKKGFILVVLGIGLLVVAWYFGK